MLDNMDSPPFSRRNIQLRFQKRIRQVLIGRSINCLPSMLNKIWFWFADPLIAFRLALFNETITGISRTTISTSSWFESDCSVASLIVSNSWESNLGPMIRCLTNGWPAESLP